MSDSIKRLHVARQRVHAYLTGTMDDPGYEPENLLWFDLWVLEDQDLPWLALQMSRPDLPPELRTLVLRSLRSQEHVDSIERAVAAPRDLADVPAAPEPTTLQCPACSSTAVVPVVYGAPTPEIMMLCVQGRAWPGGAMQHLLSRGAPTWRCPGCSHQWRGGLFAGGNGESTEDAVVIRFITDSSIGIRAEKQWLTERFGLDGQLAGDPAGWRVAEQRLLDMGNRVLDVLGLVFQDGTTRSFYFDITGFFGGRPPNSDKVVAVRQIAPEAKESSQPQAALVGNQRNDGDWSARQAAVRKLTDQATLADVARTDCDWRVRMSAVIRLVDEVVLAEIAASDADEDVRRVAKERLRPSAAAASDPSCGRE